MSAPIKLTSAKQVQRCVDLLQTRLRRCTKKADRMQALSQKENKPEWASAALNAAFRDLLTLQRDAVGLHHEFQSFAANAGVANEEPLRRLAITMATEGHEDSLADHESPFSVIASQAFMHNRRLNPSPHSHCYESLLQICPDVQDAFKLYLDVLDTNSYPQNKYFMTSLHMTLGRTIARCTPSSSDALGALELFRSSVWPRVQQTHQELLVPGHDRDNDVWMDLPVVNMFCGAMETLLERDDLSGALQLLQHMKQHMIPRTHMCYVPFLYYFADVRGNDREAFGVLRKMQQDRLNPKPDDILEVVALCGKNGNVELADEVFQLLGDHPSLKAFSVLLEAYNRCGEHGKVVDTFRDASGKLATLLRSAAARHRKSVVQHKNKDTENENESVKENENDTDEQQQQKKKKKKKHKSTNKKTWKTFADDAQHVDECYAQLLHAHFHRDEAKQALLAFHELANITRPQFAAVDECLRAASPTAEEFFSLLHTTVQSVFFPQSPEAKRTAVDPAVCHALLLRLCLETSDAHRRAVLSSVMEVASLSVSHGVTLSDDVWQGVAEFVLLSRENTVELVASCRLMADNGFSPDIPLLYKMSQHVLQHGDAQQAVEALQCMDSMHQDWVNARLMEDLLLRCPIVSVLPVFAHFASILHPLDTSHTQTNYVSSVATRLLREFGSDSTQVRSLYEVLKERAVTSITLPEWVASFSSSGSASAHPEMLS